jgi:hypothetical protein
MTASEIFEIVAPGAAATVDASLIIACVAEGSSSNKWRHPAVRDAIHVILKVNPRKMGVKRFYHQGERI